MPRPSPTSLDPNRPLFLFHLVLDKKYQSINTKTIVKYYHMEKQKFV